MGTLLITRLRVYLADLPRLWINIPYFCRVSWISTWSPRLAVPRAKYSTSRWRATTTGISQKSPPVKLEIVRIDSSSTHARLGDLIGRLSRGRIEAGRAIRNAARIVAVAIEALLHEYRRGRRWRWRTGVLSHRRLAPSKFKYCRKFRQFRHFPLSIAAREKKRAHDAAREHAGEHCRCASSSRTWTVWRKNKDTRL